MKKIKTLQFDCKITNFENINPLFSKVKIRIASVGTNANGSFISKESFEKALPTIFNCPIIGEYFEETDSFGSHGGRIIIDDKGIKWEQTTQAYGLINDNSEITWEIIEEGGVEKEYLCATGYLWTGRFPELEQIIEKSAKQSMELEIQSGNLIEIDNKKYFALADFLFSGFCILGSAEPCFPSSDISAYSLNNETVKEQFFTMMKELKQSLNQSSLDVDIDNGKGGQGVKKFQELFEKYAITKEQILEFDKDINFEEISVEDMEAKIIEFTKKDTSEVFTLTGEQFVEELYRIVSEIDIITDRWGDTYSRYYYTDYKEPVVFAIDRKEGRILVGFDYSKTGDAIVINKESAKRYKIEYAPFEDGVSDTFTLISDDIIKFEVTQKEKELQEQFATEKESIIAEYQAKVDEAIEKYTKLEQTSAELQEYQAKKIKEERESAEKELFDKFTTQLSEDEVATIREVASEFTIEQLEDKLFVLVGKKNAKFTAKPDKGIKINLPPETPPKSSKSWAKIME